MTSPRSWSCAPFLAFAHNQTSAVTRQTPVGTETRAAAGSADEFLKLQQAGHLAVYPESAT